MTTSISRVPFSQSIPINATQLVRCKILASNSILRYSSGFYPSNCNPLTIPSYLVLDPQYPALSILHPCLPHYTFAFTISFSFCLPYTLSILIFCSISLFSFFLTHNMGHLPSSIIITWSYSALFRQLSLIIHPFLLNSRNNCSHWCHSEYSAHISWMTTLHVEIVYCTDKCPSTRKENE